MTSFTELDKILSADSCACFASSHIGLHQSSTQLGKIAKASDACGTPGNTKERRATLSIKISYRAGRADRDEDLTLITLLTCLSRFVMDCECKKIKLFYLEELRRTHVKHAPQTLPLPHSLAVTTFVEVPQVIRTPNVHLPAGLPAWHCT